jgi:hypothetical protein
MEQQSSPDTGEPRPVPRNAAPRIRRRLLVLSEIFGALGGGLTGIGTGIWFRLEHHLELAPVGWAVAVLGGVCAGLLLGALVALLSALILRPLLHSVLVGDLRPPQASLIAATSVAAVGMLSALLLAGPDYGSVLRAVALPVMFAWGTCLWSCNRVLQSALRSGALG